MTVDAIKSALGSLSDAETNEIYAWMDEVREAAWDRQMEQDFAPGRRGQYLLDEAKADIGAGRTRPLEDVVSEAVRTANHAPLLGKVSIIACADTGSRQKTIRPVPHPSKTPFTSLQLKPVGAFWSVRISRSYRALAYREDDIFTWFWIGPHDEYEKILYRQ